MAYVVTEPCLDCKYTDCVVVCPCECFREGDRMLYIFPDDCIDCGACLPECPTEAIYRDVDVPEKFRHYVALNAREALRLPVITEKKERPLTPG
jgi:ferredoxin